MTAWITCFDRRRSLALAGFLLTGPMATAQGTGPGLPKVTFPSEEVGKRIHLWDDLVGRVPKAMMFQGHLVLFQNRSKQLSAFDISDPRNPKLISSINAQGNGDEHVVPAFGTKVVASGSIVDYADPAAPKYIGRFGGYFLSVWPTFQWPYLYNTRTYDANGASSPLAILDYTNPAAPRQVKTVDAVSTVGFTTGTTHVVGNLLLVTSGDVYAGVSAWDIADPLNPELISVNKSGPGMYTSQQYGKYIVTTGPKNLGRTAFFDYSNPEDIRLAWDEDIAGSGDYAHFQNGFLFGSRLDGGKWIKYDITARKTVLTGTVPTSGAGKPMPTRYAIPMGNMLFLGDPDNEANGVGDGKTGTSVSGLFVHQARPDSVGPALLFADPPDGAIRIPVTGRVGLAFDEEVDNRLLHPGVIQIRPAGGAPLTGEYTHTLGVVNFTPRQNLAANTTYEVTVPQGALKDWSGNGNAKSVVLRFSTGSQILTGLGGPASPRATWRVRPRLVSSLGSDGTWTIRLAGWDGLDPAASCRVDILDPAGRRMGFFSASGASLREGFAWKPSGGTQGPMLLRMRHQGRQISGWISP